MKKKSFNITRLDAHQKLLVSSVLALIVFLSTLGRFSGPVHFMLTWLSYTLCSLSLSWLTILKEHPADIPHDAHKQDSSQTLVFAFVVAASLASLLAIIILLQNTGDQTGRQLTLHILLSMACVIGSWTLVHTIFTFRYAHLYYCDLDEDRDGKNIKPGGLLFPEEDKPDYLDFTYFSFVIGMTFQVSDVQITAKRIRRLVLMHALLSFAFNTVIVAFSINILAGMMQK
jgi:uncharacterized membrane protein